MRSLRIFIAAILISCGTPANANTENMSFFVRCEFDSSKAGNTPIYVLIEMHKVSGLGGITTFDPKNTMNGLPFLETDFPKFDDGRFYLSLSTDKSVAPAWELLLQSEDPRRYIAEGIEAFGGMLGQLGNGNPRMDGNCVLAAHPDAKKIFNSFVAGWKDK